MQFTYADWSREGQQNSGWAEQWMSRASSGMAQSDLLFQEKKEVWMRSTTAKCGAERENRTHQQPQWYQVVFSSFPTLMISMLQRVLSDNKRVLWYFDLFYIEKLHWLVIFRQRAFSLYIYTYHDDRHLQSAWETAKWKVGYYHDFINEWKWRRWLRLTPILQEKWNGRHK